MSVDFLYMKSQKVMTFVDNVAEVQYGNAEWNRRAFFLLVGDRVVLSMDPRYWSLLDGDGKIVWGRECLRFFFWFFP